MNVVLLFNTKFGPQVGTDECFLFEQPGRLDEMERVEGTGGWIVDWHGRRVLGFLPHQDP